jgi:hypothetical protein
MFRQMAVWQRPLERPELMEQRAHRLIDGALAPGIVRLSIGAGAIRDAQPESITAPIVAITSPRHSPTTRFLLARVHNAPYRTAAT